MKRFHPDQLKANFNRQQEDSGINIVAFGRENVFYVLETFDFDPAEQIHSVAPGKIGKQGIFSRRYWNEDSITDALIRWRNFGIIHLFLLDRIWEKHSYNLRTK